MSLFLLLFIVKTILSFKKYENTEQWNVFHPLKWKQGKSKKHWEKLEGSKRKNVLTDVHKKMIYFWALKLNVAPEKKNVRDFYSCKTPHVQVVNYSASLKNFYLANEKVSSSQLFSLFFHNLWNDKKKTLSSFKASCNE